MVTIVDYKSAKNETGKEFLTLVLQSDVELIQSKKSGNFYATTFKAHIPATFNEAMCKKLLGKQIPGKIVKVQVEEYEFTIPETGEKMLLDYSFKYEAETATQEEAVFKHEVVTA